MAAKDTDLHCKVSRDQLESTVKYLGCVLIILSFIQVITRFSRLSMLNVQKGCGRFVCFGKCKLSLFQCLLLENVSALADICLLVVFQNAPGRPAAQ